jgi:hypothetical protein
LRSGPDITFLVLTQPLNHLNRPIRAIKYLHCIYEELHREDSTGFKIPENILQSINNYIGKPSYTCGTKISPKFALIGLLGFVTVLQEFLKPWLSLVSKEDQAFTCSLLLVISVSWPLSMAGIRFALHEK